VCAGLKRFWNNMNKENIEQIKNYYKYVDENKINSLLSLFSEDIIYVRCGHLIKGKDKLKAFYTEDRRILGNHKLNEIINNGDKIITRGVFKGTNKEGSAVELQFADFFYLNERGEIKKRYTYLLTGFSLTK